MERQERRVAGHPCCSLAPGTRALRRASFDGRSWSKPGCPAHAPVPLGWRGKSKRKMRRERPGALLARRTRTIRLCSSDARSRGQPWPPPPMGFRIGGVEEKKGKKGGLAIPCARATRGLRRPSLDARTTGNRQASQSHQGKWEM